MKNQSSARRGRKENDELGFQISKPSNLFVSDHEKKRKGTASRHTIPRAQVFYVAGKKSRPKKKERSSDEEKNIA